MHEPRRWGISPIRGAEWLLALRKERFKGLAAEPFAEFG